MTETDIIELPHFFSCNGCDWHGSSFRVTCPACGATEIEKIYASGSGIIADFVPVSFPPQNLNNLGKYASVLVKFDENFQMFGIISEKTDEIAIGDRVRVAKYNQATKELFFRMD